MLIQSENRNMLTAAKPLLDKMETQLIMISIHMQVLTGLAWIFILWREPLRRCHNGMRDSKRMKVRFSHTLSLRKYQIQCHTHKICIWKLSLDCSFFFYTFSSQKEKCRYSKISFTQSESLHSLQWYSTNRY